MLLPLPALFILLLVLINQNDNSANTKGNLLNEISTKSSSISKNDQTVSQDININNLSVAPNRCRGCGRCAIVDAEHFKMKSGIAIVISQENLNTNSLTSAVRVCPTNAITLN